MNRTVRPDLSKRERGGRFWNESSLCRTWTNLEKKIFPVTNRCIQFRSPSRNVQRPFKTQINAVARTQGKPVLTIEIMFGEKLCVCDTQIMRLNKISIVYRIHKCLFCTGCRTNIFFAQYFMQFWETEALWKTVRGNSNFLRRTTILRENSKIAPLKEGGVNTRRYFVSWKTEVPLLMNGG